MLSGVEFVVIENEEYALLGREPAIALEVLKLGPEVNTLKVSRDRAQRESNIF